MIFVVICNIVLASLGLIALFSSVNKMNGETSWAMRAAFATMAASLVGQVLVAIVPDQWQVGISTITLGGIACFAIGSRRIVPVPEAWVQRVPWMVWGVLILTWAAFFVEVET